MKKLNLLSDSSDTNTHTKLAQNLLKKKPKKQFQLLYRQRDESIQENPIESIIFVKSKPCKPTSNDKKIKVQEQFKKIMNDLNAHLSQHKRSTKNDKKNLSATSTQYKATVSTKKCTKESEFLPKKQKPTERENSKVLKTVNKGIQNLTKEKSPNFQNCKSPKKSEKHHLSPKSKNILSPKSAKIQKENIQTRKFTTQKLQRKKSPQQKLKPTQNIVSFTQNSHRNQQQKRNIKTIPLKVQEYILIEDNFQLVKQKSLYKLQTKLLSTYRNNYKDYENKLLLKENVNQDEIVFQRIQKASLQQSSQNFIERSQVYSLSSRKIQRDALESEQEIQDESRFQQSKVIQKFLVEKIVVIQKWWRKILKINNIKKYVHKLFEQNQILKLKRQQKPKQYSTTPVNIASAQSIQFNDSPQQDQHAKQNQEMSMLKNQNEIIRQKKIMHEKILKNLLKQKKISKQQFDSKMVLVQKQYEKELKDIMNLYKLIESSSCQNNQNDDECKNEFISENEIKIIQGEKIDEDDFDEKNEIMQIQGQFERFDQDKQQEEVQMKIYKIGDKITSEMQSYIQTAKKNNQTQENKSESKDQQNDFISQKYNKRTNQLGQQYFQDFEQEESSNQASPHKILEASNFEQFQSEIDQHNQASFQPNAHFIKMLQKFKQQQEIKTKVEHRVAIQMGALKLQPQSKYTLDTSILGIHQFLVNFFKFYLYYYKDQFLRFINMPYGYQPQKRLKFIQGYQDNSDDLSEDSDGIIYGLEYIISDDVFQEFIEQYYGTSLENASPQQKALIECSQIHDRALFQCFNEALNNFRPYYSIGGPPYIWNCSEKTLTFYYIAEQNIQQVFEKTQFRVMKWASALLGLFAQGYDKKNDSSQKKLTQSQSAQQSKSIQQILQNNQNHCHPSIFQNREQRLIKEQRLQLIDSMSKWNDTQEQRTSTLYELSSLILEQLVQQFAKEEFFIY